MDYNERAILTAEAVNPAYLPWDVLNARTEQQDWDGQPVAEYREGDRVWHQPRMGRGWYGLVLDGAVRGSFSTESVVVLPEAGGVAAEVSIRSLTLLRRA